LSLRCDGGFAFHLPIHKALRYAALMVEPIKSAMVAVVAGLIAAVKLARVESSEIDRRSPRVRAAISDSVSIAQMLLTEAVRRQ
jgi:hypothetical protein